MTVTQADNVRLFGWKQDHGILTGIYAHSSHTGEMNGRNNVYILGGHRALTDVWSTAHDMSCRTPVSNWELASRWASHAEGGNVIE